MPATISDEFLSGLYEIVRSTMVGGGDRIGDVYCSLPRSQTGHARSPNQLQEATMEKLAGFAGELRHMGIAINYVLNGPWQGGRERTNEGLNMIMGEVESLISIGISGFILSNPYLISKLRVNYPGVQIVGSVLMRTSTVEGVGRCIDLGCDTVVIDSDSNRDFRLLGELGRTYGERIKLIANTTCLRDCPLHTYHSLESGLLSMLADPSSEFPVLEAPRFCMERCYRSFRSDPVNFLKMPWIRPEDVGEYEKVGIRNLKIQGRTLSAQDQLVLIKAYLERESPSDDLFSVFPGFLDCVYGGVGGRNHKDAKEQVHVSNNRLNRVGFFRKFVEGGLDCRLGCRSCGHCQRVWETLR